MRKNGCGEKTWKKIAEAYAQQEWAERSISLCRGLYLLLKIKTKKYLTNNLRLKSYANWLFHLRLKIVNLEFVFVQKNV